MVFITASNKFPRSIASHSFFTKRTCFDLQRMGCSSLSKQQVSPFYHDLDLDLVGLIGHFLLVAKLLFLVVEQLLNPNLSSSQCFKEIFGGGQRDAYTFS